MGVFYLTELVTIMKEPSNQMPRMDQPIIMCLVSLLTIEPILDSSKLINYNIPVNSLQNHQLYYYLK